MPFTTSTPYMNLTLPLPTLEPGPQWASELNSALFLVDSHNHTPGQGAPLVSASLTVNGDLPFNDFNATILRSTRFFNNSSNLSLPADIGCLYEVNGDIWWNNALGQQVKITSGASLNAGAIGGFGGDYATSGALALYTSGITAYSFTQDGTNFADMRNGSVSIYRTGTSDFAVTLKVPSSLSASYNLTMPTGNPAATTALSVSATGQILAGVVGGTVADVIPNYGLIPTGAMLPYGGRSAPTGYLMCDGTSYLITTYPALAAALFDSSTGNYAYGSADSTHFNVPDTRGMFLRGVTGTTSNDPDSAGRTANNTGGNTGNHVGSQQSSAVEDHLHNVPTHAGTTGNQIVSGSDNATISYYTSTTGMTSGSSSTETRPLNLYVTYIIKT